MIPARCFPYKITENEPHYYMQRSYLLCDLMKRLGAEEALIGLTEYLPAP